MSTSENFNLEDETYDQAIIDDSIKNNGVILDKNNILKELKKDGLKLQNYSEAVRNDFECCYTAMKNNYKAYEFIGEKYKFYTIIVDLYWQSYIKEQNERTEEVEEVSEVIYDKAHILRDLKKDGLRLQNYCEAVRNDFECCYTAMKNNYKAYEFIGEKFKFYAIIIDLYWESYIKEQEELEKNPNADFIPKGVKMNDTLDKIIQRILKK